MAYSKGLILNDLFKAVGQSRKNKTIFLFFNKIVKKHNENKFHDKKNFFRHLPFYFNRIKRKNLIFI